jgi:hypothetical protein
MTVKTRIDGGSITLELSVSIGDEDRNNIGEYQTEQEYVKRIAQKKVKEEYGRIRGIQTIGISSTEQPPGSDTDRIVYNLTFYSQWGS